MHRKHIRLCERCSSPLSVTDTRQVNDTNITRRTMLCKSCGNREYSAEFKVDTDRQIKSTILALHKAMEEVK